MCLTLRKSLCPKIPILCEVSTFPHGVHRVSFGKVTLRQETNPSLKVQVEHRVLSRSSSVINDITKNRVYVLYSKGEIITGFSLEIYTRAGADSLPHKGKVLGVKNCTIYNE